MNKKFNLFSTVIFSVLILYSIVFIAILIWAGVFSLANYEYDIMFSPTGSYLVWPQEAFFENYSVAYKGYKLTVEFGETTKDMMFLDMLGNSLIFAIGMAFAGTLAPCLMGYITSQFRCKANAFFDGFVLVVMVLPIVGALPAAMILMDALNLMDSYLGLSLKAFTFLNMYYFIFKAAFGGLSRGYTEAACIDGASNITIFLRIMLPLVKTTFLTVFVLLFVADWNSYINILQYAPNKPTVSYGFYLNMRVFTNWEDPTRMAGAMILMLPILLFYVFANKYLMGNLTIGGMKG